MAAKAGCRVLLVDTDPQASAYRVTRAMTAAGNDPGYTCVHELSGQALRKIRDANGMHLVLVDTPGALPRERREPSVLGEALRYSDLAIVCTDMTAMSVTATMDTVAYVTSCGCRPRVLLNAIPPGATRLELEARQFLAQRAVDVFGAVVYRRAVHGRCIAASMSLAAIDGEDAGRAKAEVLAALAEIVRHKPVSFPGDLVRFAQGVSR